MKKRLVIYIPLILVGISVVVLLIQAFKSRTTIITGMAEASEIDVVSKVPGRVDSIVVDEGDTVRKGELLARFVSREIDAKVGQARGAMEAAAAKYEMARNGARKEEKEQAEKMYLQAGHQFELAEKTFNRVQQVYRDSIISTQEFDQVQFQYRAAKEQLDAARARFDMARNGARKEDIRAAEALFHQAEAAYKEACAYQDETRLVSPIEGEVGKRVVDAGEIAPAGYPVLTIVNPADIWVVLQVREDQMSSFGKGDIREGIITALGNKRIPFKVTSINPMAEFATWRATNQKGDFDLKTFEIHLRPLEPVAGFRPGMTVHIEY